MKRWGHAPSYQFGKGKEFCEIRQEVEQDTPCLVMPRCDVGKGVKRRHLDGL
jgi:hypothetical protein